MSNRYMIEMKVYSMEKDVKQIFADVTFGASGAPSVVSSNSKGLCSITRTGTGAYDVVFGVPGSTQAASVDVYKKLLMFKHVFIKSTAPSAPSCYIAANNISSTGTISIVFNLAGTATDPASGEEVLLQFIFGDSNT